MNYYFNKNTNKIYSFEEEVEFSRFPQFEPLTPEQAAWYEAQHTIPMIFPAIHLPGQFLSTFQEAHLTVKIY